MFEVVVKKVPCESYGVVNDICWFRDESGAIAIDNPKNVIHTTYLEDDVKLIMIKDDEEKNCAFGR